MKKFDGVLLCTDLDGTLLCENKAVSKENLEAIEYFKQNGGLFTFITGRPPIIVKDIYNIVKPNAPIGCFNGSGVYDFKTEHYLWTFTLPKEAIQLVEQVDVEMPEVGIQLNLGHRIVFSKDNNAMEWFREVTGAPNDVQHYRDITEPWHKVVFMHDEDEIICKLANLLNNHPLASKFDFIRSEKKIYEILPKGMSKAISLQKIAEILGIDPKRTIAVGDYNNDIKMIQYAGVGYAVSNARDEVKAAADRVTVSNEQHAIAKIIEELDNGTIIL